jgi:UrcA family protein
MLRIDKRTIAGLFNADVAIAGDAPSPSPCARTPLLATHSTVSKSVRTDDLDHSTTVGRARLERRLAAAVTKVCAEATPGSPAPPPQDLTCVREQMARARAASDRLIKIALTTLERGEHSKAGH